MKQAARNALNFFVRCLPRPLVRHVLKSFWYQPRLQDSVRYHVEPYRYESAIPTSFDVDRKALQERRCLPGIELDESASVALLEELKPFARELDSVPLDSKENAQCWFRNGGYEDADAASLYAMIRWAKPRKFIEIGCGFSSRFSSAAIRRNQEEENPCECCFIEPYPPIWLRDFSLPGELIVKKIQDVPFSTFESLKKNDILFIDTTHVVKAQSDCVYELLEILPRLSPGVLIHIHDIFTPYDYPAEWLLDNLRPFNEQYALECLLTRTNSFEILLPLYLLFRNHLDKLKDFMPRVEVRPAAFWIRSA